jgi:hypothetical protein
MLGGVVCEQNLLQGISHQGAVPELLQVQPLQVQPQYVKLKPQTEFQVKDTGNLENL